MPKKHKDLTGVKFGKRTVLGIFTLNPRIRWQVLCECGNKFSCLTQDLNRLGNCINCKVKEPFRLNRRKRPYEAVYNLFVQKSKHPVALTYEQYYEIAREKPACHYCGSELKWSYYRDRNQNGSNLDRKDSTLGYNVDNIVPCCRVCNITKNNNFSYLEFLQIGNTIKDINHMRALALLQTEIENEQSK